MCWVNMVSKNLFTSVMFNSCCHTVNICWTTWSTIMVFCWNKVLFFSLRIGLRLHLFGACKKSVMFMCPEFSICHMKFCSCSKSMCLREGMAALGHELNTCLCQLFVELLWRTVKSIFVSLWEDQRVSTSLSWENPPCLPASLRGPGRKSLPFFPTPETSLRKKLSSIPIPSPPVRRCLCRCRLSHEFHRDVWEIIDVS